LVCPWNETRRGKLVRYTFEEEEPEETEEEEFEEEWQHSFINSSYLFAC
jgi:hypothetical protein